MSYSQILELLGKGKQVTDFEFFVVGAPVRHFFMVETVRKLVREHKRDLPRMLEIGSFFGASTLSWAYGIELYAKKGEITCVDSWEPCYNEANSDLSNPIYEEANELLKSEIVYEIFKYNISKLPPDISAIQIKGRSDIVLPQLRESFFDIVYIDGSHSYPEIKNDILNAVPMIRSGGFICGDDLNIQLHECSLEHVKENAAKDLVKYPGSEINYHPGVTLAVGEVLGEVSCYGGFWIMRKISDNRWEKVDFKGMKYVALPHFSSDLMDDAGKHFADIKKQQGL